MARVFVLLVLFREVGEAAKDCKEAGEELDHDLARAYMAKCWLLYYTQLGAFIPPMLACDLRAILIRFSRDAPPPWIRCTESTWRAVQAVLVAWAESPLDAAAMDKRYKPRSHFFSFDDCKDVSSREEVAFFDASHVLPEPTQGASILECDDLYDGSPKRLRFGWQPNPTLVDHSSLHVSQRTHGGHVCEQQSVLLSPFDDASYFTAASKALVHLHQPELFATMLTGMYLPCGLALQDLCRLPKFAITLELGDMHTAVESCGPAHFDRCWLSNVPDYTSMLQALLYFVPALKDGAAVMEHTLLLVLYDDLMGHCVYSHTRLRPEHVALCTGAVLRSGDVMDKDGRPRWGQDSHRGRQDFLDAGRDAVLPWLHRLLLLIVWPPLRDPHQRMRENAPLTMSTLFRAVERLHQVKLKALAWDS